MQSSYILEYDYPKIPTPESALDVYAFLGKTELQIMVCIHEAHVCVVRCAVRAEVSMDIAVVEPFGTHVIKMV